MNKYRITAHHIVFFIFVVSNIGGCLTPIGDPPLFLGYLKGVPFWWVAEHCWPMWAVGLGILLTMFFVVDTLNFRRAPKAIREKETAQETWRFDGGANVFFLLVILGAVFINNPIFLREALMIGAAVGSYFTTRKSIHEANDFNFHPIQEVAILFIGIFATMIPALREYFGKASIALYDGGYYTKTPENRPLAGPLPIEGAYVCGAVSGYGLMASGAMGELTAAHITHSTLPEYASQFVLARYADPAYQHVLQSLGDSGQL